MNKSPEFSLINTIAEIYQDPPRSETAVLAALSDFLPNNADLDKASRVAAFVFKFRELFDLALLELVALGGSPKIDEHLAYLTDLLVWEYIKPNTDFTELHKIKLRLQAYIARVTPNCFPVVYLFDLIKAWFLNENMHKIENISDEAVLAALKQRYDCLAQDDSTIGAIVPRKEKEKMERVEKLERNLQELRERLNGANVKIHEQTKHLAKIDKALSELTGLVKSLVLSEKSHNIFEQAEAEAAADAQTVQAPAQTVQAPAQTAPTVKPLEVHKPKTRQEREIEEYLAVLDEFEAAHFDGKFDLVGALASLEASIGKIDLERFMQLGATRICEKDKAADMSQIFKILIWAKSNMSVLLAGVKAATAKNLDLKNLLMGFIRKDRGLAFSASEAFRSDPDPNIQQLGFAFMGW